MHRISEHHQGNPHAGRKACKSGRPPNEPTNDPHQRTAKLEGIGCRRKRVEDIRFVQGKGDYVDESCMPGMLFGDFVRSPFAHARIKAIRRTRRWRCPASRPC